jgi:hypothetical protein
VEGHTMSQTMPLGAPIADLWNFVLSEYIVTQMTEPS